MKYIFTLATHFLLLAFSYHTFGQPQTIKTAREAPYGSVSFASQMQDLNVNPSGFVDGYVTKLGESLFLFPVGHKGSYRPFASDANETSGAYFRENPQSASLPQGAPFGSGLDEVVQKVSDTEFWDINGPNKASLTLTWDAASNVGALTDNTLNLLTIAGWNPSANRWENIPSIVDQTAIFGGSSSLTTGSITASVPVKPDDFSVYTLARLASANKLPEYAGAFESASCTELKGWVWDANHITAELTVELFEGNTVYASAKANIYRENLNSEGISGYYGFVLKVPSALLSDNINHQLSVRVRNSDYVLSGSPRSLSCGFAGRFEATDCASLSGWVWDKNNLGNALEIEILEQGRVLLTTRADQLRAGSGDGAGNYGFNVNMPASLRDGKPHSIEVRAKESGFVLTGSPQTISCGVPDYKGSFEVADCNTISGWAWDKNNAAGALTVEIMDGGNVVAQAIANEYRADLKNAGYGTGKYGFSITVPDALKTGNERTLTVRVKGSETYITGSKTLNCNVTKYKGTFESADCNTISGWAWDEVNPGAALTVQILDGTRIVAEAPANQYRAALKDAGTGTGNYGFAVAVPGSLKDGKAHTITVRIKGSNIVLAGDKTITCAVSQYAGSFESGDCSQFKGYVWDQNNPSSQITIELMEGGLVHAVATANLDRADLRNQGMGTGMYGFSIPLPAALKDGVSHAMTIRILGTNIKLPGTKTVNCSQNGAPSYAGSFDSADCNGITGYVWDQNNPGGSVTVELMEAGVVHATAVANISRAELREKGVGTGLYGFNIPLPAALKDGAPHALNVRIKDTRINLPGTKTVNCFANGNPPSYAGTFEFADCAEFTGFVWDQNNPGNAVTVELMEGGVVHATALANISRQDLKNQGKGTGLYGFSIPFPTALKDGNAHVTTVRIKGTNIRLAGSKTVNCSANGAPPSYAGSLEFGDCAELIGYVWDQNNPNSSVSVELMEGGIVHAAAVANLSRPDLKNQGMGTGLYGFSIPIPAALKDGVPHALTVRIKGANIRLPGTKTLSCVQNTTNPPNYAGSFEFADCSEVTGYIWDQNNTGNPVSVELMEGGIVHGRAIANTDRPDLKSQGIGTGLYGFVIPLPATLKDGNAHALTIRIKGTNIRLPFTRTINCVQNTNPPSYAGSFETGDCFELAGYVWDQNNPNSAVTVELMEGGLVHTKVIANLARADLKNQGIGTGQYGFSIPLPAALKDGAAHSLTIRIRNTSIRLAGAKTVLCSANGNPPSFAGSFEGANCSSATGYVWDQNNPNSAVTVELMEGGTVRATATANLERADLKNQNVGTGLYGFDIPLPASLKDGAAHALTVRIKGTSIRLPFTRTVTCAPGARMAYDSAFAATPKPAEAEITRPIEAFDLNVNISPNPTRGIVSMSFFLPTEEKARLYVINTAGQVLQEESAQGSGRHYQKQYDLSAYPEGMYLIKVERPGGAVTKRVVLLK